MASSLQEFRSDILRRIFLILLVPASIAFLYVVFLGLTEKGFYALVLYAAVYIVFLVAALRPAVSVTLRLATLLILVFALGLSELIWFGQASMGLMLFAMAVLLSGIFHGVRIGAYALLFCVCVALGVGLGYESSAFRIQTPQQIMSIRFQNWLMPTTLFFVVGGGVTAVVAFLLQNLGAALERTQRSENELAALNRSLENRVVERTGALAQLLERSEKELQFAARAQRSFLPAASRVGDGWEISASFQPATIVSGDIYDLYLSGDKLLGFSVFDVSGHGVGSGLLTLLVRSVARRAFFDFLDQPLGKAMGTISAVLDRELVAANKYATGVMVRIQSQGMVQRIEYTQAGHPEVLLRRAQDRSVLQPYAAFGAEYGTILGFGLPDRIYSSVQFDMQANDALLVHSDGLTDLVAPGGEETDTYGVERLQQKFAEIDPDLSAAAQLEKIISDFESFRGAAPLTDDTTALVLRKI